MCCFWGFPWDLPFTTHCQAQSHYPVFIITLVPRPSCQVFDHLQDAKMSRKSHSQTFWIQSLATCTQDSCLLKILLGRVLAYLCEYLSKSRYHLAHLQYAKMKKKKTLEILSHWCRQCRAVAFRFEVVRFVVKTLQLGEGGGWGSGVFCPLHRTALTWFWLSNGTLVSLAASLADKACKTY